jgi:hypothetical protein
MTEVSPAGAGGVDGGADLGVVGAQDARVRV